MQPDRLDDGGRVAVPGDTAVVPRLPGPQLAQLQHGAAALGLAGAVLGRTLRLITAPSKSLLSAHLEVQHGAVSSGPGHHGPRLP